MRGVMPYHLLENESIGAGIKRMAHQQVQRAILEVDNKTLDCHDTVHQVRKRCKKVRALLRRIKVESGRDRAADWLMVDNHLRIHLDRRLVEAAGQEVHLTRLEFDLLKYLAQRPGVPCARADLIDAIWGYDEAGWDVSDAAVNTCIAKLRAKIVSDPANPRYIQSVHGVGYRFKGP